MVRARFTNIYREESWRWWIYREESITLSYTEERDIWTWLTWASPRDICLHSNLVGPWQIHLVERQILKNPKTSLTCFRKWIHPSYWRKVVSTDTVFNHDISIYGERDSIRRWEKKYLNAGQHGNQEHHWYCFEMGTSHFAEDTLLPQGHRSIW